MNREPFDYQARCLKKYRKFPRLPLFWEMRLGKSPTCVWWLKQHQPQPRRVLIVCPKSTILSWKEELNKFEQSYTVVSTLDREWVEETAHYPLWMITNFETITADGIFIHKHPWDAVVVDESHRLKNPKTKTATIFTDPDNFPLHNERYAYKSQFLPAKKPQLRAILTGTPAEESYLDYFNQFKFLFGKMGPFHNYYEYRRRFFYTSADKPGRYIPKPEGMRSIAAYLGRYANSLTRKQVGRNLPNVLETRTVELAPDARKIYDEFEKKWYSSFLMEMMKHDFSSEKGPTFNQLQTQFAFVAQNVLYQFACGFPKHEGAAKYPGNHKLNEVKSILKDELRGEKVVIWCKHLREIEVLSSELENSSRIYGAISLDERASILERWRTSSKNNILICQIRSMGVGMDLSASDTQIFFSKEWSSTANSQAVDRLIHPSKKDNPDFASILTINIVTENTVDEDLNSALVEKKYNANVYKWFLRRTGFLSSIGTQNAATPI